MNRLLILLLCFVFSEVNYAQECNDSTHSSYKLDSWSSCEMTVSPNNARPAGHWIMYDLGHVYNMSNTHFWNYNKEESTAIGFRNMAIDYSLDGLTWQSVAEFELGQATGLSTYPGIDGPSMSGITARYILLYALDTWNHPSGCGGLSEIRFDVSPTIVQNHWIGVESEDWDDPLNWGENVVPNRFTNVIIPSQTPYQPNVNIHSAIKSLEIQSGAELDIQSKRKLKLLN